MCVLVDEQWFVRVGLVNSRGRENTCLIIRTDKGAQAQGGSVGGWGNDEASSMSGLFIIFHF